jgi:DNA-binding PadR family transcriptional regulator
LAILHLLKEESMHGYQIMKELEERSDGAYSASAGTIYPALQEMLDQHMIELESDADKKVYFLSEKGNERLMEFASQGEGDFWVEWKERMVWRNSEESLRLRAALEGWETQLRRTMRQIRGNPERVEVLIALIDEMTSRLKNHRDQ